MSDEPEITEGTRVKIDRLDARDSWLVLGITGNGAQERFQLVHVEYADMTREVCRDRIKVPPQN